MFRSRWECVRKDREKFRIGPVPHAGIAKLNQKVESCWVPKRQGPYSTLTFLKKNHWIGPSVTSAQVFLNLHD